MIDIELLIERRNLDYKEVARHLFPLTSRPQDAMRRIINGKQQLTDRQKGKLADMADLTVADLGDRSSWTSRAVGGILYMRSEDYLVEVDTKTWVAKMFHCKSLIHEHIDVGPSTPISEFIVKLNKFISY